MNSTNPISRIFSNITGMVARGILTRMSRKRLPKTDGEIVLSGLLASVEIIRDQWGVPHIYAETVEDLFFAQGFVHAQDRLWQMELNRRIAQGQLSEVFGELALDTDRATRTFGFNHLGRVDWASAENELRDVIQAYAAGINAFIENPDTRLPIEFSLVRHRPEPWRPEDCTAFARLMLWKMSHAWYGEIIRAQLIEAVGEEHAAELEIHYPQDNPITLPNGIEFNRLDPDGMPSRAPGPFLERGLGSNAWAISGNRSATGRPVLCNDMHLPLSQPGLWYFNHLSSETINVTGVSIPGAPLVQVGHNDRIAWGMTLAFTDAEDLFIEKLDPDNPHRYRFKNEWREAEVRTEIIKVKGRAEPHQEKVVITHHGPIISDAVGFSGQRVAINSMALRPGPSLDGWRLLNRADNWDDFVAAMKLIDNTQLNVSYADVEGNIGHWVTGKVPVRSRGDGRIPVPGWTGEYEWEGFVPFEEMPHSLNPETGYVVSCNHRLVPDDYPHYLGNVWMNGYRARRIEAVFDTRETLSINDFCTLHMDFTCLPGIEFVSRLDHLSSDDPDARMALETLRAWDGKLTPESIGGTVYEVTRYFLVRNLLEPGLGEELSVRLMGQGFHPLLLSSHEFYGHDTVTMLRLLDTPDSWWVRQAGGREAVLRHSLKQAVQWLRETLGQKTDTWQWGKIHRVVFAHALGLKKPLDQVFNRGPFPIGGDTDTLCQTAHTPEESYDNILWAPSFRQIVDMGDLSKSVFSFPSGQSGHLGSPHYDDLIEPWLKGDYLPMLWTRGQVEDHAKDRLVLSADGSTPDGNR